MRLWSIMRDFRTWTISAIAVLCLSGMPALAQTDPVIRGGL